MPFKKILSLWLVFGLAQCSSADTPSEVQFFSDIRQQFTDGYAALSLPALTPSFKTNLQQLGDKEALTTQKAFFSQAQETLNTIDVNSLETCERIDYAIMKSETELGLRRAALGLKFLGQTSDISAANRLRDLPMGKDWYDYYLDRWNHSVLDFDDIFAFGEQKLRKSVKAFDQLQAKMGFEDDLEGLLTHLDDGETLDEQATLDLFKTRQNLVWGNLAKLFTVNKAVKPVTIARSDRGANFPADGYYQTTNSTFYYNIISDGFEARQADWLFIHEGTPGHHYQISSNANGGVCNSPLPDFFFAAHVEGWGAYVETLGDDLGLYQTDEARLAAIEWNMVRSARVALDVGINAYGWSDERALKYWQDNVRGQSDIAMREINRMKRWPAQVVTYKYGANQFDRLKQSFVSDESSNAQIRAFHDIILSYGPMPFEALEQLLLSKTR